MILKVLSWINLVICFFVFVGAFASFFMGKQAADVNFSVAVINGVLIIPIAGHIIGWW